ncbi:MAG: LPS-assembly protein LptD [Pseudorhodobacter sp.]|nr:LPS-assembly protein LptD [Rhizobacter sp.]
MLPQLTWMARLFLTACTAGSAAAQGEKPQSADASQTSPRGEAARQLPTTVFARELRGRPDKDVVAEGDAELRRAGVVIKADRLSYDQITDLAAARGNVQISRDGNFFSGPEMEVTLRQFQGFFKNPTYFFGRVRAGGVAQRLDFFGEQRAVATQATYSSCASDGSGGPAWLLTSNQVSLNFDANEGIAEGAVLRFLGVPILVAPRLSFPLTDERKSGWLPPTINIDSKSGLQVAMPYYWNIAPNRDATFTPTFAGRRGVGLDGEFRYLASNYDGIGSVSLLPNDRTTGRARYGLNWAHGADLAAQTQFKLQTLSVSDNNYWKDFPRAVPSFTPRLLSSDLQVTRSMSDWSTYARVQKWQLLQSLDAPLDAPYERVPQVGARFIRRLASGPAAGFEVGFEGEFNRFANPNNLSATDTGRPTGLRVHALSSLAYPYLTPGWSLTPKLSLNAASYALDAPLVKGPYTGRQQMSRLIPSVSVDSAWVFERDTTFFGKSMRQTLEPRVLYVNTPFRDQTGLPNFDAAAKDFNFDSIYTDNSFTGIDRVADAHQLTTGVTTRVLDPQTGAEALRLGVVQRYLFRDQLVTPDGQPFTQRVSDVLLLGSTSLIPNWTLDASVQYSPDIGRTVRSIVGARYSPGPYRTINATHRLARGLGEQLEIGWQWPVYGPASRGAPPLFLNTAEGNASCRGTWYAVGRINYSTSESRLTDSVLGLEYDAGCWIGRVVAERLSTGRSEAVTRLLLQLELVGLSRLGSNPLQVLKDNIPGYRLLHDPADRSGASGRHSDPTP